MSPTNIRKAGDLIRRAGKFSYDEIAVVPDLANIPIHTVYRNFSQEELEDHNIPIQHGHNNIWIKDNNTLKWERVCTPPAPRSIPQITISQGLKDFWTPKRENSAIVAEEELAYLLVVHGQAAASQPKLMVKRNLEAAAAAIMDEVLNGFSVVFCGAVLKSAWRERRVLPRLVKVNDPASLKAHVDDEPHVLRILC